MPLEPLEPIQSSTDFSSLDLSLLNPPATEGVGPGVEKKKEEEVLETPTLSQLTGSQKWKDSEPAEQVAAIIKWKDEVSDYAKNSSEREQASALAEGVIEDIRIRRGYVSEFGTQAEGSFRSGAEKTRAGVFGFSATALRAAAKEAASQGVGVASEDANKAVTNQNLILSHQRNIDRLRSKSIDLSRKAGSPSEVRDEITSIAGSIKALEEAKALAEKELAPIIKKAESDSFLGNIAFDSQAIADESKRGIKALEDRYATSKSFRESLGGIPAGVASGIGDLPRMALLAISPPGQAALAAELGQGTVDKALEINPDMSPIEQLLLGTWSGGTQMALEKVGLDPLLKTVFNGKAAVTGSALLGYIKSVGVAFLKDGGT